MGIFDSYSKRRKVALKSGQPDVFTYDEIPQKLRVQVVYIWNDALGHDLSNDSVEDRWDAIHDIMARELGVLKLGKYGGRNREQCIEWFLSVEETDHVIDMIELSFRIAEIANGEGKDDWELRNLGIRVAAKDAIDELNIRFRESDLGYQFTSGKIIRVDDEYVHSEIVKPALAVLSAKVYENARTEFLTAHKHYRDGHTKDSIVAANRSFESTLKAICKKNDWKFASGDRASELVATARKNGLFPDYLGRGLDAYIAMLKTGLPDVRNNAGGHGDAPAAPEPAHYFAAYALHLTAANILLLITADESK